MNITTCSVTVMRSHDYCHFSVTLGGDTPHTVNTDAIIEDVDRLRKIAARLADKAVEQYKVAKKNQDALERDERQRRYRSQDADRIAAMPETERSPEEQATLKAWNDRCHEESRRERYDYEDEWPEDRDEDEE
jgi:hypothetical protein